MDDFFSHENHPWPPSISDNGKICLPNKKSDLLVSAPANFQVKIFDGPAIVHFLNSKQVTTFDEYGDKVFLPWTDQQLHYCDRIDIIWDRYIAGSLKESTREKRGKGIRSKVQPQSKLPSNFADFLRDPSNKTELFGFLTDKAASHVYPSGKQVYITSG